VDAMNRAIEELMRTGSPMMTFTAVLRDGGVDFFVIDGPLTNSGQFKREFGDKIRAQAASGEVVATILVSDSWITHDDVSDPKLAALRKAFGLELKDLADLGMIKVSEAISVHLESPLICETRHQEYLRKDGRIELTIGRSEETRPMRGRLSGFFPTEEARHA
jgi:hypothetical protein